MDSDKVVQILTLLRLIEGIKAKNHPAIVTFLDLRKVFDSIYIGKLMAAYGVSAAIVSAIKSLYTKIEAQVLFPDVNTDFFEILVGVLQGDMMAPFLSIITLDYAIRIATKDETNVHSNGN